MDRALASSTLPRLEISSQAWESTVLWGFALLLPNDSPLELLSKLFIGMEGRGVFLEFEAYFEKVSALGVIADALGASSLGVSTSGTDIPIIEDVLEYDEGEDEFVVFCPCNWR